MSTRHYFLARVNRSIVLCWFLAVVAPTGANGATEWATWGSTVNNTSVTGTFKDGRTVQLTSFFDSISGGVTAGGEYTASPAIPGQTDGTNPSFIRAVTGTPHPSLINPGALILTIDLTGFTVDADSIFGLGDLRDIAFYRLELLDSSLAALPLAGLQTANYNLTLTGGVIADLDVTFNSTTGALKDSLIHDGGGTYRHSGLVTFTGLPAPTRFIRMRSNSTAVQDTEGIQIYFGGSASAVPIPAAGWLLGSGLLGLIARSRRKAGP
jgi:hypothetical protein